MIFNAQLVEEKLKCVFRNKDLLRLAFTHRSFWNEHQENLSGHNERLEFLGDSVLGLLVAEYLFSLEPSLDEGTLSSLRSQLVDAPACANYAQKLEISPYLLLGKGEQMNHGKGRESIVADLFEALIGALYLDQGVEVVRSFFFSHFLEEIKQMVAAPQRNWKAELQDYAQKKFQQTPNYALLSETGPAHCRQFRVAVWINEKERGVGEGSSKKEAQIAAARNALVAIEKGLT